MCQKRTFLGPSLALQMQAPGGGVWDPRKAHAGSQYQLSPRTIGAPEAVAEVALEAFGIAVCSASHCLAEVGVCLGLGTK